MFLEINTEAMLVVGTNYQSLVAQRNLGKAIETEEKETLKLSSGNSIYRAAYDPSGLAIATTMRAKSASNLQAQRNVNDSVSLFQVAEGTLGVMHGIAGRLRELSMQAANDTMGDSERIIGNKEYGQLVDEVKRLTASTKFNGHHIINGEGSVYDFQIGVNNNKGEDQIRYDLKKILASENNFGLNSSNILSKDAARENLKLLNKMTSEISSSRAKIGSAMNRMESTLNNLQIGRENIESSKSKITDTDFAASTANKLKNDIIKQSSTVMLAQANIRPQKAAQIIINS